MKYTEYGAENRGVMILLHGGGLGPWNYRKEAEVLAQKFHVILPVLDGHRGSGRNFLSIEENARTLLAFIDDRFGGNVLLLGGLSLGGQIVAEMLSLRSEICRFAIIESAQVLPMPVTACLIKPILAVSFPLVKKRWFAKLQFASLHMKPEFFEEYFRDSKAITKDNLTAILKANMAYSIKKSISKTQAEVLVLAGSRERKIMKTSVGVTGSLLARSSAEILQGYRHGELSLAHPGEYAEKLLKLINRNKGEDENE